MKRYFHTLSFVENVNNEDSNSLQECDCKVACDRSLYEPSLSYGKLSKFNVERMLLSGEAGIENLTAKFYRAREASQWAFDYQRDKNLRLGQQFILSAENLTELVNSMYNSLNEPLNSTFRHLNSLEKTVYHLEMDVKESLYRFQQNERYLLVQKNSETNIKRTLFYIQNYLSTSIRDFIYRPLKQNIHTYDPVSTEEALTVCIQLNLTYDECVNETQIKQFWDKSANNINIIKPNFWPFRFMKRHINSILDILSNLKTMVNPKYDYLYTENCTSTTLHLDRMIGKIPNSIKNYMFVNITSKLEILRETKTIIDEAYNLTIVLQMSDSCNWYFKPFVTTRNMLEKEQPQILNQINIIKNDIKLFKNSIEVTAQNLNVSVYLDAVIEFLGKGRTKSSLAELMLGSEYQNIILVINQHVSGVLFKFNQFDVDFIKLSNKITSYWKIVDNFEIVLYKDGAGDTKLFQLVRNLTDDLDTENDTKIETYQNKMIKEYQFMLQEVKSTLQMRKDELNMKSEALKADLVQYLEGNIIKEQFVM